MSWNITCASGRTLAALLLYLLAHLMAGAPAAAEPPPTDPGITLRLGLDSPQPHPSKLRGGLTLGLLRPMEDGYYLGATIYSAALGEAGGLYLGGVEWGRAMPLGGPYFLDASIYLGGGGGAGQVPGDGLSTRARLGLGRSLGDWGARGWDLMLGAARLNVRGSAIHASSVELVLQRRFDPGIFSADKQGSPASPVSPRSTRSLGEPPAALALQALRPRVARYHLAGPAAFDALGIEAEFGLADSDWLPVLKTMGAARGNAQGYADWTVGARRYAPLGSSGAVAPGSMRASTSLGTHSAVATCAPPSFNTRVGDEGCSCSGAVASPELAGTCLRMVSNRADMSGPHCSPAAPSVSEDQPLMPEA